MQPPARSLSQTTTLKPLDDGPTGAGGITLPSEDEARRLFESMTFFIGYTQHHIDTREFSDRLAFFYANLGDTSQAISQVQMPWYLEMLLVFAIGKLFSGGFDGEEKGGGLPVPGASMFAHVQARLPSLSELYGLGKLGIEIHALAAVYLQNANRKEEAYLYWRKSKLGILATREIESNVFRSGPSTVGGPDAATEEEHLKYVEAIPDAQNHF
ncbi:hypothetical protein COL5a_000183 [Colletotrichum fioriniae]|nr:hypothetical protein COL5a_000183 [Colletotrichum fioriniae]